MVAGSSRVCVCMYTPPTHTPILSIREVILNRFYGGDWAVSEGEEWGSCLRNYIEGIYLKGVWHNAVGIYRSTSLFIWSWRTTDASRKPLMSTPLLRSISYIYWSNQHLLQSHVGGPFSKAFEIEVGKQKGSLLWFIW